MIFNKKENYPRVLIISGFGLDTNSATDITMRSYFSSWPPQKLLIITSVNEITN